MKLRNKKTGEIGEFIEVVNIDNRLFARICTTKGIVYKKELHSLSEIKEVLEDYEEPKELYWVNYDGSISHAEEGTMSFVKQKQIGNYFETKEEAEQAVEKLKAWKRLKDLGFRFVGKTCEYKSNKHFGSVFFEISGEIGDIYEDNVDFYNDLDSFFGGEDEY